MIGDVQKMNVRFNKKLGIVVTFIAFMWPILSAEDSYDEFSIVADSDNQNDIAVYGDTVVWDESYQIYGYSLSKGEKFLISSAGLMPAIYGNIVIWVESRNSEYGIYGRDLSTWEDFQVFSSPETIYYPAIHETTVIWSEDSKEFWDILGIDLVTRNRFRVTNKGSVYSTKGASIYANVIVWEDYRNGNPDVYGYDLSTSTEFQIKADIYYQSNPAIFGDIVVYDDDRNGNVDIYGYNLLTGKEFQITSNNSDQYYAAIYKNIVVWVDERNAVRREELIPGIENFDVYGYNLETDHEFPVTTASNDQVFPVIYEDIVVWEDYRNCTERELLGNVVKVNSDIYGCRLPKTAIESWDKGIEREDGGVCSGAFVLPLAVIAGLLRRL
jgi:beta propeller repeat protein